MADRLSVLVVDDSRSATAHVAGMIEEIEGVELVGTAPNGASAVRLVSELQPDVVLMDIVMPGMDGMATLRLLNANHPEVRVAMLSSVGGTASRAEEAFRLGAVQVLGKPVEREILTALFDQLREADPGSHGEPE